MFPGANAQIYRNEAGEPIGWDYPSDEPYDPYDDDSYHRQDEWLPGPRECKESGLHGRDVNGKGGIYNDDTNEWVNMTFECVYCEEVLTEEERLAGDMAAGRDSDWWKN